MCKNAYICINSTHHATRRTASQGASFAFLGHYFFRNSTISPL